MYVCVSVLVSSMYVRHCMYVCGVVQFTHVRGLVQLHIMYIQQPGDVIRVGVGVT